MPLDYRIIDTTLREGEQHERVAFSLDDKLTLARMLAGFGVDYIEVTSPFASPGSFEACRALAAEPLGATRVVAHVRCLEPDLACALETGVTAINMVIAVSPRLRKASHGMAIDELIAHARRVVAWLRRQRPDIELRFSTEDTFRAPFKDVMLVYGSLAHSGGIDRYGVSDTTGGAAPDQVAETVRRVSDLVRADIEFHSHDDTGCAVANAYMAVKAGATHVNTSVLGLGERNGITSLEGFTARMYADDPEAVRRRYRLAMLPEISRFVADHAGLAIPFNACIVGEHAFTHKAGIHTKAVLRDPGSYEVLHPDDFGRQRSLAITHKLTGYNAVQGRASDLGLVLTEDEVRAVTREVKALADTREVSLGELDQLLARAAAGTVDEAAP